MWCAIVAGAVQEPYDIDLKELRRPPVRRATEQRPLHEPKEKEAIASQPDAVRNSSSYIVKQGDHLFLILMRNYGLSNEAAERFIPEIMRLNNISNPKGLAVGQHLTIPFPSGKNAAVKRSIQKRERTTAPDLTIVQTRAAGTTLVREVVAPGEQPCLLVRLVSEQLGLLVSPYSSLVETESVSLLYDALKMVVVCKLAPDEAYTLERLLAIQGVKLLVFKGDEAPHTVIEGVIGVLGIPFAKSGADPATGAPLTYMFPAAISGRDLRLIIRPEDSVSNAPP